MSREAELIKEINEHIKKAGDLYGLELPDSDLQIIRAALKKRVEMNAESKIYPTQEIEGVIFTAHRYICPDCGAEKFTSGSFLHIVTIAAKH